MAGCPEEQGSTPSPRVFSFSQTRWLILLLALGLGLRAWHYVRNPSMWHDEAALVLNVLDKSWAELLGPLYFSEAAPPLFLWIEKAAVGLLGDGTYALRLVPFLASCAVLLLLVPISRRLLSPAATLWALLLFGFSDRLLWHSCEAKPYAVDVFVAVGLLLCFLRTMDWPLDRQLVLHAGLGPILLFLSYPACFLLGGLALSLLPGVLRSRRPGTCLRYGLFLGALGGAFLVLWAGPIRAQRDERILQCWQDVFPTWDRPWTVPGWTVMRVTEIVRYAAEPTGNALAVVAAVGAALLVRSGRRRLAGVLLLPVALAGVAGLLGQYPFRASRVMAFAAPAALLLTAAGLPPTWAWLRRHGRAVPLALAVLALLPVAHSTYRAVQPWDRADAASAAALVRARCRPGEAVVGTFWEHEYYFRDRLAAFRFLHPEPTDPPPPAGPGPEKRVWLLAAGKTADERRHAFQDLRGDGWALMERFEFDQTTVFHLRRRRH